VANTQGGHFFAATLEEHNRNVTKYRQLLKGPSATQAPPVVPLPPIASKSERQPHQGAAQ
jgi:hypothetical protein